MNKNAYIASLVGPGGDLCGYVVVYASTEQAARGLLMCMGVNDYCDLRYGGEI
jgi:hypothetical protein